MAIKRLYDTLVGATVNVNQLCNSSSVTVPNGHKYYMIKGGTASIGASTGTAITGLTSGTDIVIDLTAMLGSTIADYLYSLETATAGAGVAKLKEWGFLTEGYIPYNAGILESVEARSHVMRDADENIIGNYNLGTDTLRGLFKLDAEYGIIPEKKDEEHIGFHFGNKHEGNKAYCGITQISPFYIHVFGHSPDDHSRKCRNSVC